jgi:predicted phosphodiesterase
MPDFMKWCILIVMYFCGWVVLKLATIDQDKRGGINLGQMLFGQYVKTPLLYCYTFLTTCLFDRDYDNWFVKIHWLARDSSLLGWELILYSVVGLLLSILIVAIIDSRVSVYRATIAIILEQLVVAVFYAFILALYLNLLYCGAVLMYGVAWAPPEWLPSWVAILWRIGAIITILLTPLVISYVGLTVWPIIRIPVMSVEVLAHVLGPFFAPSRYPHVISFSPLPAFALPSSREQDESVAAGRGQSVVVCSDTHLPRPGMGVIDSSRPAEATLLFLQQTIGRDPNQAMILAGDVTDRGDSEAWDQTATLFQGVPKPVLVIPGNHDVHFKRVIQGIFTSSSFTPDEVGIQLKKLVDGPASRVIFPVVKRVNESNIVLLGLDSNNRPTSTPITNALGLVGSEQLRKAQAMLGQVRKPGDVLIVVLHHHILLPPFSIANAYLRCLDADKVLTFALNNGAAAIIHGHKHMPYVCQYHDPKSGQGILIASCGSAHHNAGGLFKDDVVGPSCYRLVVQGQAITKVELIRDTN